MNIGQAIKEYEIIPEDIPEMIPVSEPAEPELVPAGQ